MGSNPATPSSATGPILPLATQYFDPATAGVSVIPNNWVKVQPGPVAPPLGPSPFVSYPVGREPQIFINPKTGQQKWDTFDSAPAGWVPRNPLAISHPSGDEYINPATGEIRWVAPGAVQLQPAPPPPGSSYFGWPPSYIPGQEPRLYVNPGTGEQQWVSFGEKPPEGWVQLPGPAAVAISLPAEMKPDTPARAPARAPQRGANVVASDQPPQPPVSPQQPAAPTRPAGAIPAGPAVAQAPQPAGPDNLPHTVEKPGTGSTDAVPTTDLGESKLQTDEYGNVKHSSEGSVGLAQVREDVAIVDHLADGKFPVSLDRDGNPVVAPPPAPPAPPKPLTDEDKTRLNFIDNQIAEAHNAGNKKREKVWTQIKANYANLSQAFLDDLDDLRQLTDLRDQAIRDGAGPTMVDAYVQILGHINEKIPFVRHLGHAFLGLSDRELDTYGLTAELTRSVEEHQHIIALWFSPGGSNAVDQYGQDEAEKSLIAGTAGIVAGGASAGVGATKGAITSETGVGFDTPLDYIDNRPKPTVKGGGAPPEPPTPGKGAGVSEPERGAASTQPPETQTASAGGKSVVHKTDFEPSGTTGTQGTEGALRPQTQTTSGGAGNLGEAPAGGRPAQPAEVGAPKSAEAYASAGGGKGGGNVRGGTAGDTPSEGGGPGSARSGSTDETPPDVPATASRPNTGSTSRPPEELTPGAEGNEYLKNEMRGYKPTQNKIYTQTINEMKQQMVEGKFKWDPSKPIKVGPGGVINDGHHRLIAAKMAAKQTGRPLEGSDDAIIPEGNLVHTTSAGEAGSWGSKTTGGVGVKPGLKPSDEMPDLRDNDSGLDAIQDATPNDDALPDYDD